MSTWQAVRATRAERDAAAAAEQARKQYDEAEAQRRRVELHLRFALLFTDPELRLLLAREKLDKRDVDPEAVLRISQVVLKSDPEREEAWKLLAESFEATGRHADALAYYDQAVRELPDLAPVHNRLAWFLATCPNTAFRDPPRAVRHARAAVELTRTKPNSWYWNTLGVAHYRAGDSPAAIDALNKSVTLGWDDGFNSFFLAMAHARLGDAPAREWH